MMPTNSSERWALAGRRVLTPSGLRDAAVIVEGERILEVSDRDACSAAGVPVEDFGERVIMPGLIDARVSSQSPGHDDWEGFAALTRGAAAGGVTTLADMPLFGSPVTATIESLEAKRWSTADALFVDVGFLGGLLPGYQDQIEPLIDAGVLGFVAFLGDPGGEFRAMAETDLDSALPVLARRGVPVFAHPERVPRHVAEPSDDEDPRSYSAYRASRPSRFEIEGVELLVHLARRTGCAVHIGPLASRHALGAVRAARGEGVAVSVDTAPHYLGFTAELIADGNTLYKVTPPIRGEEHREGLWQSLSEGTIDMLTSSHSPVPPALRDGDFSRAFPGIASLQLLLPTVWTEALARGFGPMDLGRWLSSTPARRLGLDRRKGRLAAGLDADIVIWDPEATFQVDDSTWHHRHPGTPWNGRTLFGVVERSYVRGRRVFDRWQGLDGPAGRIVRRDEGTGVDD